jgi:hypothetical protein
MVRWVVSFAVGFVFLCVLYYVVRLRTTPEDDIKQRRREASDRGGGQSGHAR